VLLRGLERLAATGSWVVVRTLVAVRCRPPPNPSFKICYLAFKFLHVIPMADSTSTTRFGFVAFAETWNGRLAMLGFVIGLGTELLTGQGILSQIGLG